MFNSDKPIQSSMEDLLGRREFAFALSRAVLTYTHKDSLTIGLYGKWGCGKTSILNMLENELDSFTYNDTVKKPVIIRFNPWNFSDQDQLIEQFFYALSHGLGKECKKELLDKRKKNVKNFALVADAASIIPAIGSVAEKISHLLNEYANALRVANEENDLQEMKEDISSELLKIENRIIIIIDDLDRLNNIEIRQIFQLIKSLADFPNTIYLLPFDKEVVINALKDIQKGDGNEYLEKIIQVPIEIPDVDTVKLYNILFQKIDKSITDYSRERRDLEYWAKVIVKCIMPFINNLRDVNRLINVFKFKYDFVKDEVNIADLIAITSLQVFAPEVYSWIYKNKNDIVGGVKPYESIVIIEQKREKELFGEKIKEFTNKDPQLVIEILSTLFPRIDQKINYTYEQAVDKELLRTQRIASLEKFDIYFSLSIENVEVSRSELERIIYYDNYDELLNKLMRFSEKGTVISFLIEMESQIINLPMSRVPVLLQVMVDISDSLKGVKAKVFFELTALTYGHMIIVELLKRYSDENERFNALKTAIENAIYEGIPTCAYLLNSNELAHGKLAANGANQGEQLIDLNHLKELEVVVTEKIIGFSKSRNLFDLNGFRIVAYIWECFDRKGCREYIHKQLSDNINLVKFIANNASEWTSADRKRVKGWQFNKNDIEKFILVDAAANKISESIQTDEFSKLDIEVKRRAIAFILWDRESRDNGDDVTLDEVDQEMKNWKVG